MKTIKLSLIALISALAVSFSSEAQNYLCSGNNIKFSVPTTSLTSGDIVKWYWDAAATVPVTAGTGITFETISGVVGAEVKFTGGSATDFTTITGAATEKKIYAKVVSGAAGACEADDVKEFSVIILPALTITNLTDISTTYCENNTLTGQTITATVGNIASAALPTGVSFEFAWTLKKDSDAAVAVGTGTVTGNNSVLTYTSPSDDGSYTYAVTASYNVGTGTWIGTACTAATADETFTVSPAPVTPAISAGTF